MPNKRRPLSTRGWPSKRGPGKTRPSFFWNTVYLGRAVDELRSRGETVPDEIVAHIAILDVEHIAFNGDYVWPDEPLATDFRPQRNPRAPLLDAP